MFRLPCPDVFDSLAQCSNCHVRMHMTMFRLSDSPCVMMSPTPPPSLPGVEPSGQAERRPPVTPSSSRYHRRRSSGTRDERYRSGTSRPQGGAQETLCDTYMDADPILGFAAPFNSPVAQHAVGLSPKTTGLPKDFKY